jgi:predicted DNA-binding protein YlxM (UPF0122 family)
MIEDMALRAYLFDFYAPLLTGRQANVWDRHYHEDLSLAEIAAEEGVSRQAVFDLLQRTEKILLDYEARLGLVERFQREKERLTAVAQLLAAVQPEDFVTEDGWRREQAVKEQIEDIIASLDN